MVSVEALTRALIHVATSHGSTDERGFAAMRQIRAEHKETRKLTPSEFKSLAQDPAFMMLIDPEAALAAVPELLPQSLEERRAAFTMLREVVEAAGPLPEEGARRLRRIARLFDLESRIKGAPELLNGKLEGRSPEKPAATIRGGARREQASSRKPRGSVGGA